MIERGQLRPFERRVLALADQGVDDAEIARRFRRSPEFVARVRRLTEIPRAPARPRPHTERLRPLERRIMRWYALGADDESLAPRFRRSPDFIGRVGDLARYKLSR
jgi:DNA-binding CsgD family transcriptional regulator